MIDTVTVYQQGARVRRRVALDPGASEVKLAGLPLTLDDGSVRVAVEGSSARAADVHVGVEVPPDDASLPPPRDEELRAAERDVAVGRAEAERLGRAIARLDALVVRARPRPRRGEAPGPVPTDARVELARLRARESERLSVELAACKAALRHAERRHAELDARARRATSARNTREHELRKTATVRLDGRAEAGAELTLEYLVPGARWSPSYTLWLEDDGRARLAMRAVVAQRTGEDWAGAKLVLSTAAPQRWTELPELPKLRIGRAQPPKAKRAYREPPEGAAALYADYDRAFGSREAEPRGGGIDKDEAPPDESAASLDLEVVTPVGDALAEERTKTSPPMLPPLRAAATTSAAPSVASPMRPMAGSRQRTAPPAASGAAAAPPVAPTFDLDVEAMAYGRLRMFGPSSPRRGELVAVAAAEVYAEGLGVAVDVAVAVHVAVERAEVDAPLPPGQAWPAPPDAFDYAYAADVAADVPSDGAFHVVPIVEWAVPAKLRYVAVPREASDVFRVLDLECPDAALLDGPVEVYERQGHDYTYLLTGRVASAAPRARLALGLGVEQAIKVARNVTFAEESAGLLGGRLALVHDLAVDLKNNLGRPVDLEVRERVPVKREDDEDVEIVVSPATPAWKDWTQDDSLSGGRVWAVSLDAGAEKTFRARYTVRIAAKHELAGGNRRES